jgi:WhiB family transcriptional regulator, redox-sensing transcriptional regulator
VTNVKRKDLRSSRLNKIAHITTTTVMNPMLDEDWRTKGRCRSAPDPDAWFPEGDPGLLRYAQEQCSICPVREACANWALTYGEKVGVWGGMTENERSALMKKSGRKPLPQVRLY